MAGVTVLLGRAADAKQDQTTILLLRALDALSRCAAAANVYRPDDTAGAAGPAAAAAKAFSGKGLRASGSAANAVGSATSVLAHRSELPQSVGCLAALLENFGDSVILSDSSDRPDSARPNACAPALCPRFHSPIVSLSASSPSLCAPRRCSRLLGGSRQQQHTSRRLHR
jgi:hypothetical protein